MLLMLVERLRLGVLKLLRYQMTERMVTYRLELVGFVHCYRDNTSECSVEGYSDTPVQVLGACTV